MNLLALLFLSQILLILLNIRYKHAKLALLPIILTFAATYVLPEGATLEVPQALGGQTLFSVTSLGLLFMQFLTVVVVIIVALAPYYYKSDRNSFFVQTSALVFAFTGLAFCVDWYTLLVFWELITLIGFFLILPSSFLIAKRYLLIHLTGAGLLFLAATRVIGLTGTANLVPLTVELYPLVLVGMGFKVGLLGIHFWLPEAHGRAPAPASALLSGVIVKAGLLGYHKVGLIGYEPMLWFGFGMVFWGGLRALMERDLKRLLAYSTVSQLGYMLLATSSPAPVSMQVAAAYAFGHAFAKSALFLVAGLMEKHFGSRDLSLLRGISRHCHGLVFVIACLTASLAGLPLTYGFISKGALKYILPTTVPVVIGLYAGSIITLLYMLRLHRLLWTGSSAASKRATDWQLPRLFFAVAFTSLVLGLFPAWPVDLLSGTLEVGGGYSFAKLFDTMWPLLLVVVLLPFALRLPLERLRIGFEMAFVGLETFLARTGTWALTKLRSLHTGDLGDYLLYVLASLCTLLLFGYYF